MLLGCKHCVAHAASDKYVVLTREAGKGWVLILGDGAEAAVQNLVVCYLNLGDALQLADGDADSAAAAALHKAMAVAGVDKVLLVFEAECLNGQRLPQARLANGPYKALCVNEGLLERVAGKVRGSTSPQYARYMATCAGV